MSRPIRYLPLLAVAGALLAPAAADAAYTAERYGNNDHVMLTGTEGADSLMVTGDGLLKHDATGPGFAGPYDFDTRYAGSQVVYASAAAPATVTAVGLGGDDRLIMLAPNATGAFAGGPGDDAMTGSPLADDFVGSEGDDEFSGRGGSDRMRGGPGADRLTFDGTDNAEGIKLKAGGTDVVIQNTTIAGATSVYDTEEIWVSARGGNDIVSGELIAPSVALRLDGDAGDDRLTGGRGNDRLIGGAGADTAEGMAGDDVVGAETATGGEGNDRVALELGKPMLADGGPGADVTQIHTGPGADSVGVRPQDGDVFAGGAIGDKFFDARVRGSESLHLDLGAGDDGAAVAPGAGSQTAVTINGGTGDDGISGSDGMESLAGLSGRDFLDGGLGRDRLFGGADDDLLRTRDGSDDVVACEGGLDTALADLGALDQLDGGCERVERALPAPNMTPLARVIATGKVTAGGDGELDVPIACSAGARGGCHGTLTLVTSDPVRLMDGGFSLPALVASAPFALAPGTAENVRLDVAAHEGLLRVAHDAGGPIPVQAQALSSVGASFPVDHTTPLLLGLTR